MAEEVLWFRKLSERASPPVRATPGSAGIDLASAGSYLVPARSRRVVDIDICIQMPDGCYGLIAGRSGKAFQFGLDVFSGIIDADYVGGIRVLVWNHGDSDYQIVQGEKICQLILQRIVPSNSVRIVENNDLFLNQSTTTTTMTLHEGFGSTGK